MLQDPTSDWKITSQWMPIRFTNRKRSDFFTYSKPNKDVLITQQAVCNQCYQGIFGPRFLCRQCKPDFNWCWGCMSDADMTHDPEHIFVKIDSSRDSVDYDQKNKAAKLAACKVKLENDNHPGRQVGMITAAANASNSPHSSVSSGSKTLLKKLASKYWHHPPTPSIQRAATQERILTAADTNPVVIDTITDNSILEVAGDVVYKVGII
jgi:hypothetical protein